jgi:hypothetical protein
LPYFENKKSFDQFIRIDRNYLFGSFEITSIRLFTPLGNTVRELHGVYNLIEVISSWIEQKLRSILDYMQRIQTVFFCVHISPSEKTSSGKNSIICTAWLMKSHDITMEDRHPDLPWRNVGFSHQGFVLEKFGIYLLTVV